MLLDMYGRWLHTAYPTHRPTNIHGYVDARSVRQRARQRHSQAIRAHHHHLPFYPIDGQATLNFSSYHRARFNYDWLIRAHQFYRHYLPYVDRQRARPWKAITNTRPMPVRSMKTGKFSRKAIGSIHHEYEQEIRYVPYSMQICLPMAGHFQRTRRTFPRLPSQMFGADVNMNLPPKIRVIFMPSTLPLFQAAASSPLVRCSSC
jgi:hypothetical protein